MTRELSKTALFYAIGALLLGFYGIEVCPFLEDMEPAELAGVIAGAFVLGYACRAYMIYRLRREDEGRAGAKVDIHRPWKLLVIDLGVWLCMGFSIAGWNLVFYGFPVVESGMKVVLGCVTLGVFAATAFALDVEAAIIRCIDEEGMQITGFDEDKFLSITTKFLVFIGLCMGLVFAVLLMLVYKDFAFIIGHMSTSAPYQFYWIIGEVLFVFVVLLAGTVLVMRKYSRNLSAMFSLQLGALERVQEGQYEAGVPVVSHDEFSLIALQTNRMIDGLREKERLRSVFGKYVDGMVAQEILECEAGADLGGREAEVAVLFTDIRDFTSLSERCTPQEVIEVLNEYFTLVVDAVHRYQGVLDKFIGDEAMAVFGLEGGGNASEAAVETALDIGAALGEMGRRMEVRGLPAILAGIGIHYGGVVAGNIGSQERLEYTVIGDTVNTAARLEQLTKSLPSSLAVSQSVYEAVSAEMRERLAFLGERELKGKSAPLSVYGLLDV